MCDVHPSSTRCAMCEVHPTHYRVPCTPKHVHSPPDPVLQILDQTGCTLDLERRIMHPARNYNVHSVAKIQSPADMALALVRQEFPNYHPLVSLTRLAHKQEVIEDPKLEFEVHKAILPYVTPKLSSIEVKSEIQETRRVIVSLFEQHTLPNGNVVEVEVPLVTDVTDIVPLD